MKTIKTYLGFTDDIKEPRKTKVENILDRTYRYNDRVMNTMNFLCTKVLEGDYLEVEENSTVRKKTGERTKSKTEYRLMHDDENGSYFFELKKTEYDFVKYLLDNKINTEEKMLKKDNACIEKIEAAKRIEEESEQLEAKKEELERIEADRFEKWISYESTNIPDYQKKIVDSVFISLYGTKNPAAYELAFCINNYDNPRCKEEIKSRLCNGNNASIKVFEYLSGLKVPTGYKDRMAYLDSITSADFKDNYMSGKFYRHTGNNLTEEIDDFER